MMCASGALHGLQLRTGGTRNRLAGTQKSWTDEYNARSALEKAINLLDQQGKKTDNATYVSLVRLCTNAKALSVGRQVHAHISRSGKDQQTLLANHLVQMYGKCGSLKDARAVFDNIRQRDLFSWNFMIAAYGQNGHGAEALKLYRHMQMADVKPNKFTFFPLLSAAANLQALAEGKRIHKHITASGFESEIAMRTALFSMYGKCGGLKDARAIFDQMNQRDTISWNAMIAAYAQNGHGNEALKLFRQMDVKGVKPSKITFLSILNACATLASLEHGRAIHNRIVASGLGSDFAVKTALVSMYRKCGSLKDARAVFNEMPERDVISWTAMIGAYAKNGQGKEALELFRQMDAEGIKPNSITFLSLLEASGSLASLETGREIHEHIVASGFESNVSVKNALVTMYGKCGSLKDSRAVFDEMHEKNVIAWTAMITAYAQNEHGKEALKLLQQMDLDGIKPNSITFLSIIDACVSLASLETGRMIHQRIIASGLQMDVAMKNALVNMYGKCSSLKDARAVFHEMHERDTISWNAMIAAYAQNGCGKEALELFQQMNLDGVKPDSATFLSILDACSSLASLENGRLIHERIVASGLESHLPVKTALLIMYGKCGSLKDAQVVFDEMRERDVISWNSMIAAYAQHGHGKEALALFRQMQLEGVKPTSITFLSIFNACSHSGLLDEGWQYFASMIRDYGITPLEEHFSSMIDLLGRSGYLDDAEDLINNMPIQPSSVAWAALLSACRIHGDAQLGKRVANHVSELDPDKASTLVLISNIYAAAGR